MMTAEHAPESSDEGIATDRIRSRLMKVVWAAAAVAAIGAAVWEFNRSDDPDSREGRGARLALAIEATNKAKRTLAPHLESLGVAAGDPVFIRVFKETSELELWMQPGGAGKYVLVKTYPVAKWSGTLGPKLAEGDRQAPEGVYSTNRGSLNPYSKYHLSFDIHYPNAFDKAHGRTGSLIMIHGSNVSLGCFAMTDPVIEEIYALVEEALKNGQGDVPVHCFPFRMTSERMKKAESSDGESKWLKFWSEGLLPVYTAFEKSSIPPVVQVKDKRYVVK